MTSQHDTTTDARDQQDADAIGERIHDWAGDRGLDVDPDDVQALIAAIWPVLGRRGLMVCPVCNGDGDEGDGYAEPRIAYGCCDGAGWINPARIVAALAGSTPGEPVDTRTMWDVWSKGVLTDEEGSWV